MATAEQQNENDAEIIDLMSAIEAGLTKSTGKALRWNYVGMAIRMGFAFGINALLSRLLGPAPFGELGVAMIVFGFGNLISNVGLTSALIQKESMDDVDIRFCFTCQMLTALVMTGLLFLTAPFLSQFFRDPHLVVILRVFSLLFVLQAFGTTANALLTRKQDAVTTQSINIISYVIAYVAIGVPLALYGAGVWSLVAAWLSQALINSLLLYLRAPHSVRPRLHPDHRSMVTFGMRILGANICSWSIFNLDNTFVGRIAGPIALGYYSRAFVMLGPADNITMSLLQVLLPAFSRLTEDTQRLRQIYASIFGVLVITMLPPLAAISATADVVVVGLYGQRWMAAIPYVRPIALAMAFHAIMSLSGPLLASRGKPQKEFRAQLISVLTAVAAYLVALHWSIVTLSWTVLVIYIFRFFLLTRAVNREIGTRWLDLLATAGPGIALGVLAAGSAYLIAVGSRNFPSGARLLFVAGGSAGITLVAFALSGHLLLRPIFTRSPQLKVLVPRRLNFLIP